MSRLTQGNSTIGRSLRIVYTVIGGNGSSLGIILCFRCYGADGDGLIARSRRRMSHSQTGFTLSYGSRSDSRRILTACIRLTHHGQGVKFRSLGPGADGYSGNLFGRRIGTYGNSQRSSPRIITECRTGCRLYLRVISVGGVTECNTVQMRPRI